MSYRLIAADMDGTLLNNKGEITPATVDAVLRAQAAGAVFTLSTGRPPFFIGKYVSRLALTAPVIAFNGAMIAKTDGTVLFERGLRPEAALEIFRLARLRDTALVAWSQNRLFANRLCARVDNYKRMHGVEPEIIRDENALVKMGLVKILWLDEPDRIGRFVTELEGQLSGQASFATSHPTFLEFFDSSVSKADALARLGALLSVDRSEIMAIGDGMNDLPMIRYAGLGVAMANAPAEVRAAAGFVTASNEEDGVAAALKRFVLCDGRQP